VRRRAEVSPAFVGSLALHLSVLAALLISWRFGHDLKVGTVVPVTIVANAPVTDLRAAEQAQQEQTAQTEAPQPEAPIEAAPPEPQPAPAPPTPAPEKTPKPVEKQAPRKAQPPPRPEKSLDLDALAASLSRSARPPKPSSAAKGPSRQETALQARPDAGKGLSAAPLNGMVADIERRWHPNCEVEGGRDVQVRVTLLLDAGGGVAGQVGSQIMRGQGAVAQAAASRAVSAVYAAAPFRNLPRDYYGQRINLVFNANEACS